MRGRIERSAPKRDAAPAIRECPTYAQMCENAHTGSLRLKLALDLAGLRP